MIKVYIGCSIKRVSCLTAEQDQMFQMEADAMSEASSFGYDMGAQLAIGAAAVAYKKSKIL